jgi:signal transduction histidine kinase
MRVPTMKPKTIAIVLLLVILPTALLSLLAARALKNEALLYERRTLNMAENAMDSAAKTIRGDLVVQLDGIRARLATLLSGTYDFRALETAGRAMQLKNPYIKQVMLFMTPWGLVYPEARDQNGTVFPASLVEQLNKRLHETTSPDALVVLSDADRFFCFAPFREGSSLYVGFELRVETYMTRMQEVVDGLNGEGFQLRLARPDPARWAPVEVSDSFGRSRTGPSGSRFNAGKFLGISNLVPPMDFLEFHAFLTDPDSQAEEVHFRTTLHVWGVILLGGGIFLGLWLSLRQAALELQTVKQRSDLILSASHDLRTPLASIKMLAETLEMGHVSEPEKQREFLRLIVTGTHRLESLVERVLFFVRFDQDTLRYRFESVSCAELVRSTVELFQCGIGERIVEGSSLTIVQDVPATIPLIRADEHALSQVLMNLIENAAKYAPVPGRKCVIQITARLVANTLSGAAQFVDIHVHDNGPGMAPAIQKKIFRRFYRGPDADRVDASGVGLGLALCRHIMQAHGGSIQVSSEPGKGTSFVLRVPVGEFDGGSQ